MQSPTRRRLLPLFGAIGPARVPCY